MPVGGGLSGTGGNGLHGRLYYRPAIRLKSKVWLYCIKSCHGKCRRLPENPAGITSSGRAVARFHLILAKTVY